MKRVLMIIPNLDFGGAQKSFASLSMLLSPYCELLLVVFNKDKIAPLHFGAKLEDLQVSGAATHLGKISSFIRRVRRLKEIKKRFDPDISISFLEGADYVNLLSKRKEEIWFYIHGSKMYDKNIRGTIGFIRKRIFLPLSFSRANKILVVNNRIKEELVEHFSVTNIPIVAMKNFFDLNELDQLSREAISDPLASLFNNYFTICISGRIAPEKGIDRFIKVLPFVIAKIENLKLIIVGDGPQRDEVIEVCKKENLGWCCVDEDSTAFDLSCAVFFLGYRKNPYPFMKRATVVVLPSLNEGMPNTIAEALILGTPVISADCPYGPNEMLSDGLNYSESKQAIFAKYGILLPILDRSAEAITVWAEATIKLLESSQLRQEYSSKGLTQRDSFSKETLFIKWRELLNVV